MASLFSILLLSCAGSLLVTRTDANTCYIPIPNALSHCCSQCNAYGCMVNAGKVDQYTPCNPQGIFPFATWMFCDSYACSGGCGNCRCEWMTAVQKVAVDHDISRDALFYAFKKNDFTIFRGGCNDCGNRDPNKNLLTSDLLCKGRCGSSTCGTRVSVGSPVYQRDWVNNWDQPFTFSASGRPICAWKSIHHNHYEDRRYNFGTCSVGKLVRHYYWTLETNWDATWTRYCPFGYFLFYVRSYHDNSKEDRKFRFGCFALDRTTWRVCTVTGYVNTWDEAIDYKCPSGSVLTGVRSYHSNHHEDRRFAFRCCSLTTW